MPRRSGDITSDAGSAVRALGSLANSPATRRRLLDGAARVLVARGYPSTGLADIADEVGLQAGSLYSYFESKDQLVEEVLRYGVVFSCAHVRESVERLPEDATAGQRLEAAVGAFVEATMEIGAMIVAHLRSFPQVPADMQQRLRPVRRAHGELWAELVDAAIASGEIRDDVDPYVLRLFLTNLLEHVPEWPPRTRRSCEDLTKALVALLFNGIGTSPKSTTSAG